MKNWREFWNGKHAIYVNETHKKAHATSIINDLIALTPKNAKAIDFGCGEMPLLSPLEQQISELVLCDAAPSVLEGLKPRINKQTKLILPENLSALPQNQYDRIFVVSVVQYLTKEELEARLKEFKTLLSPQGALYLADIIPQKVSIIQDTLSLLTMALKNGFLIAACIGLIKTALSPYIKIRNSLGLTKFDKNELQALLLDNGFKSEIQAKNIGPHQHRFTVKAWI